ncbi:MAG: hypothetical protein ACQERC_03335 [Bacteroidota bacterium]
MLKSARIYILLGIAFLCHLFGHPLLAQQSIEDLFSTVSMKVDTTTYEFEQDRVKVQDVRKLAFAFQNEKPVALFTFTPNSEAVAPDQFSLMESRDYKIIDSLALNVSGDYTCKVQFDNLAISEYLALNLNLDGRRLKLPLFAYSNTYAEIYPGDGDFFIGEERRFELVTNRSENIIIDPKWKKASNYEYRIYRTEDKIMVAVLPTERGEIEVQLPVELRHPNMKNERLNYQIQTNSFTSSVKGSRLKFLQFDERQVTMEFSKREGVELQIDNHRDLRINKTYRIEDTDEKGGALIAELYTVRRLNNDKVLCMFRPYNYHRSNEGYLFIKDGDNPEFITNINILPKPAIEKVSILREGGSWVESRKIFPGETVEVRLEGEGLSRADFQFEDLIDISTDSIVKNEVVTHFLLKVPIDIRKKSINIYNGNKKTGITLDIQEYQRPRPLDFVIVDYGGTPVTANAAQEPKLHNGTIGDVTVQFDDSFIDDAEELYGKQYLEIEVRIKDAANQLVEKQVIDDIEICPGDESPRSFSYTSRDGCMNKSISINDYLSNKTHSLDHWSTIELIIKHRKNLYNGLGHAARVEIIKAKHVTFDVDLSIPAGLIIKKVGVPGFPGLSGISLSMLAQFSFYQRGEIQKLRPYKIGAGFLAKNAFNFNPDADRDLGIVVLGSVYPTKKNRKFSFPLYAGFGYFLNEDRFFYLIGPGVRINF